MTADLLDYYNRELGAVRQLLKEFAVKHPGAATRLQLDLSAVSADPHVERLIEAFALIAGRVHHKLDDEFPELTDALLNVLYPHYLAPVPSCLTAELRPDPTRTPLNDGFTVPRHSQLLTQPANPANDLRCRFRTAYPVTLWPLTVTGARLQGPPYLNLRLPRGTPPDGTVAVLQVQLECQAGARFTDLSLETLRFHLAGDPQNVADLYELVLNQVTQVLLVPADNPAAEPVFLPPSVLRPVGFGLDEGLLPYPPPSFPGYRLLTELFAYPAKFWYVDVARLSEAKRAKFGKRLDLVLFLNRTKPNLEKVVDASTFRLGCTPAVNLFELTAQPVAVTQTRAEYKVVPVHQHPTGYEVYAVDEVTGVDPPDGGEPVRFRPFYAVTHPTPAETLIDAQDFRARAAARGREAYWYPTRRPSNLRDDRGTDVFLTLVDRGWEPTLPATDTLMVKATCSNRDLPAVFKQGGARVDLTLERAAPLAGIECLDNPTPSLRPPRRSPGAYWRLVSHLSLNHLSIGESDSDRAETDARAALQEILRLYDFSSDPQGGGERAKVNALAIDGITRVASRRVVGRAGGGGGFCRGVEVTVDLDEEKYHRVGAYLFASVLERFLALYTTVNSFTQLVARTPGGERVIKRWPPRAGDKLLV